MVMITRLKRCRPMLGAALLLILIGIMVTVGQRLTNATQVNGTVLSEVKQVIIDPGHGGIDPGAVGVGGVEEKNINLKIGLYLKDILIANGYEVIMTRTEDISINDPQHKSVARIKTSDLKNRLRIFDSHPQAIAVSIHQNKFPKSNVRGAQMFYGSKNGQSKVLALALQRSFRDNLQPYNGRDVKRSTSDVYIVHNAKIPITLVECGFVSNPADAKLLVETEYQQQVAFSIFAGIVEAQRVVDE